MGPGKSGITRTVLHPDVMRLAAIRQIFAEPPTPFMSSEVETRLCPRTSTSLGTSGKE